MTTSKAELEVVARMTRVIRRAADSAVKGGVVPIEVMTHALVSAAIALVVEQIGTDRTAEYLHLLADGIAEDGDELPDPPAPAHKLQ